MVEVAWPRVWTADLGDNRFERGARNLLLHLDRKGIGRLTGLSLLMNQSVSYEFQVFNGQDSRRSRGSGH